MYCLWPNIPDFSLKFIKLLVYLVAFSVVTQNFKRFIYFATRDPLLIVLTSWACISFLWSSIPDYTIAVARNLVVLHIAAVYIAMNYDLRQQMRHFAWALGIVSFLSLLFPIITPSYGISRGEFWVGIFRHKNRLANAMVMAILVFLNIGLATRKKRLFIIIPSTVISIISLVMSRGKGALVALIICLLSFLIYWVVSQKEYKTRVLSSIFILYASLASAVAMYFGIEYILVDLLGKDLSLNGRTDLWEYLIGRAMTRPILGFGYAGFWENYEEILGVSRNISWFTLDVSGNAHSGYIEFLLQLGLVGVGLLAVNFLIAFYKVSFLLIKTKRVEFFWAFQYLLLIAVLNISETNEAWLGGQNIGWLLYMIFSISTSLEINNLKRKSVDSNNPYLLRK